MILSCHQTSSSSTKNKELASKYINEVINKGNLNLLDDIFSQDYISHRTDGTEANIIKDSSIRKLLNYLRTAFPNIHYAIDKIVADGDMVALNISATGTHKGEFMGYPASQKVVHYKEMFFFRVAENKLVEGWGLSDMRGIIQQISKP